MFDFDAGKLLIIGVVALVVIPPKDLPGVMRQVGQILGKMRRMATEFQSQFMDAIREAELDEIRKDVTKLADSAKLNVNFDPVATVRDEIKGALGEGVLGTGAIAAGSPLASEEAAKLLPSAADTKTPEVAAESALAAGIAPLAPTEGGEAHVGEATIPVASPMAEETAVPAPSALQPSEHRAPAAQEADSGRS